ncbi:MAG: hypothetical protein M3282_01120 [Gemmatimonadota bacterium]|nr:hypothetical protein [Gemmatimonadota bacterium]
MNPASVEPGDRDRFLAAVAEQVPLDRVVELHLFQPIRQGGVESGVAVIAAADGAPDSDAAEPRYTVFTARYRHVLKGPERGRWEVSVVAEAEAPLATVGAVVRGVQRRAGDAEPPEHITGDALRDAFGQGPPAEP